MTAPPDCQLTLAIPDRLTEEMIDFLSAQTDLVDGFSLYAGEGLGAGSALTAPLEKVRGRAKRTLVVILIARDSAATLLDRLREVMPTPQIAWWIMPVDAFGRLA